MNALHYAVRRGDIEEICQWLASGAPVDLPDSRHGHTALLEACISTIAGAEVMKLLEEAGADVNAQIPCARECESEPLLHAAMPWLIPEKARFLIEAGVHPEELSPAAVVAATHEQFEILDLLFAVGAAPLEAESDASVIVTALSACGEFDRLAQMLAKRASPAPLAWSALSSVVVFGKVDEAAALIDAGADLEQTDDFQRTPFLLAIHAGRRDMAALLLEKGANAQARGRYGFTEESLERPAPSYAISRDDPETLRWLLDHGFDIVEGRAFTQNLLREAAKWDAVQCCRVLLERGADTTAKCEDEWPTARGATHPEIVKMFIERGADPLDLPRRSLSAPTWA